MKQPYWLRRIGKDRREEEIQRVATLPLAGIVEAQDDKRETDNSKVSNPDHGKNVSAPSCSGRSGYACAINVAEIMSVQIGNRHG